MKNSRYKPEQGAFGLRQEENRKLRQLVADLSLDKQMLHGVLRNKP